MNTSAIVLILCSVAAILRWAIARVAARLDATGINQGKTRFDRHTTRFTPFGYVLAQLILSALDWRHHLAAIALMLSGAAITADNTYLAFRTHRRRRTPANHPPPPNHRPEPYCDTTYSANQNPPRHADAREGTP